MQNKIEESRRNNILYKLIETLQSKYVFPVIAENIAWEISNVMASVLYEKAENLKWYQHC